MFKDISGQKFGKWLAIEPAATPKGKKELGIFWLCLCECGKNKEVIEGCRLRAGRKKDGCIDCKGYGLRKTADQKLTPTYHSWRGMRERCKNPNHISYKNYGGKGISVCDEWKNDFAAFYRDMGKKPKNTSLDRIDNSKGYYKENCRWADPVTQVRNSSHFKLTDEQVNAIIKLVSDGANQAELAMALGVSRGHIGNIMIGKARIEQPKKAKGEK